MESPGANVDLRMNELKVFEGKVFVKNKTTSLNPVRLRRTFISTPYCYLHMLHPLYAMGWQISTQDG